MDELNCALGLLLAEDPPEPFRAALSEIQHDLFDLGGELSIPGHQILKEAQVQRLEERLEAWNAELAPLKEFILPGGTRAAGLAHLARTVCRRAERIMVELKDKPGEGVSEPSLKYVNRLSDYLFVAGRYANNKGAADILWAPGQNR